MEAEAEAAEPQPPPQPIVSVKQQQQQNQRELRAAAAAAAAAGTPFITSPPLPTPVGRTVQLYYNRLAGPLRGISTSSLVVKVGFNKWEMVNDIVMDRATELAATEQGGGSPAEWWVASLFLPTELFGVDFVVCDGEAKFFDNNKGQDFSLLLSGALTEEELLEQRAAAYEAAERGRVAMLEVEEARLADVVATQAVVAEDAAREEFRRRRAAEHAESARAAVAARGTGAVGAAVAAARPSKDGVFGWPLGPPTAGQPTLLVYNLEAGPLRGVAAAAVAHLDCDGWSKAWHAEVPLTPLAAADLEAYGLRPGSGRWVGGTFTVPRTAVVLDFVISDPSKRIWDNNSQRDFHTVVAGQASEEELYADIVAANAEADAAAEESAVARVRRVEWC